jgi:hypothetical protein
MCNNHSSFRSFKKLYRYILIELGGNSVTIGSQDKIGSAEYFSPLAKLRPHRTPTDDLPWLDSLVCRRHRHLLFFITTNTMVTTTYYELVNIDGTCSSQFAVNVSPRSDRLVHWAPPAVNEPVRSVLHELTGANCTQSKVTITLIAKWCIHEICIIYRSFTSWSPIYHIFNIDRMVVKKHCFSGIFAIWYKAAQVILKIS